MVTIAQGDGKRPIWRSLPFSCWYSMVTKKAGQVRPKHSPQRTCVACRQSFDKRQLTRIVQSADVGVVVDLTGKKNGRGAYLCCQPSCWDQAIKRNALNQALKTTLTEDEKVAILKYRPNTPPLVS